MTARILGCAVLLATLNDPAFAQSDPVRWGVGLVAVPYWNFPDAIARAGEFEESLSGNEIGIGIVRARLRGGDWGLSVVRKSVSDGSRFGGTRTCVEGPAGTPLCARGTSHVVRNTSILSVQLHKYWTLFHIGGVHVGLAGALGVAKVSGDGEERIEHLDASGGSIVAREEISTVTAEEAFDTSHLPVIPILGLEPAVSAGFGRSVRV
ncbi:MAG: hypothetical protein ACT4O1_14580, partial [Gemmatimonadota bacterium]